MRSYTLNIANYKIRFENHSCNLDLVPSERFERFIINNKDFNVLIKVHRGEIDLPSGAEKVFSAPYTEDISGIRTKNGDKFWSVFRHYEDLFILTDFPCATECSEGILKFSLKNKEWDLFLNCDTRQIDPLEYPLDGLILYYLTVIHDDIMIHASGVNNHGKGYVFSGISGKGKTTITKLWDSSGAMIIHDDRLILRKTGDGYTMYNTPVYKNEEPRESPSDRIFIIDHGKDNEMMLLGGATAISLTMANCIQHNWDAAIIKRLLDSTAKICTTIPVYKLSFRPDSSVIEYILKNE